MHQILNRRGCQFREDISHVPFNDVLTDVELISDDLLLTGLLNYSAEPQLAQLPQLRG